MQQSRNKFSALVYNTFVVSLEILRHILGHASSEIMVWTVTECHGLAAGVAGLTDAQATVINATGRCIDQPSINKAAGGVGHELATHTPILSIVNDTSTMAGQSVPDADQQGRGTALFEPSQGESFLERLPDTWDEPFDLNCFVMGTIFSDGTS